MKNTAILSLGVLMLALGGCTGSFSKVRGAIGEAPDWYQEKRAAISDEGFPELSRVPELSAETKPGTTLVASRTEIKNAQQIFDSHPRAQLSDTSPAQRRAEIAAIQSELNALDTPTNFLTPDEVADIHAQFDIGRAKLKF